MGATVEVKKSCCKDKPRCKRCPVVYKRLASAGLAERTGPRTYVVAPGTKKHQIMLLRRNRPVA